MTKTVFKAALPGYNADVDTDPNHFSVYYDETDPDENVLIKEKTRNSVSVGAFSSQTIAHSLGYVPLVFVFANLSGDRWTYVGADSADYTAYIEVNTTNLIIHNTSSVAHDFKYYIFYDQIL
jgi:hypothetical protein